MGTLYARIAGPNAAPTGMPNNVILPAEAVSPGLRLADELRDRLAPQARRGEPEPRGELRVLRPLRRRRAPAEPRTPPAAASASTDRRGLLDQLDTFRRQADRTGVFDERQRLRPAGLRSPAPRRRRRRSTCRARTRASSTATTPAGIFNLTEVQRWGDMRRSSNLLGKQMLLARRLSRPAAASSPSWTPAGTCTPTTTARGTWTACNWLGNQVDHAVSAFLDDVEARGLSDKILLVVTGEMGRSPRISNNGGRDHWGNLTPLLIAGGGLKMGQVDRPVRPPGRQPGHANATRRATCSAP